MKKEIDAGVPIPLTNTAASLLDLIRQNKIETFSIYLGDDQSDYGLVWTHGNVQRVLNGLHAIVQDISKATGQTEDEILHSIRATNPQEAEFQYQ